MITDNAYAPYTFVREFAQEPRTWDCLWDLPTGVIAVDEDGDYWMFIDDEAYIGWDADEPFELAFPETIEAVDGQTLTEYLYG